MSKILRYDEIMKTAIANMASLQDKVTDFNEGSIVHTILDTVSRIAERAYVAIRQGYNEMLSTIPYSLFGFEKTTGKKATGVVVFYIENAMNKDVNIQNGIRLNGGGLTFITTQAGIIPRGAVRSYEIPVQCETEGEKGNVQNGTINSIDSTTIDTAIKGVLQEKGLAGGSDIETDAHFEKRFKAYLAGLSGNNFYAVESAALNVKGVQNVATQNHKPPLYDIYNMSVYIDDGSSGDTKKEVLDDVFDVLCGNGTKENPGHIPPGVNIRVVAPQVKVVNINAVVSIVNATTDSVSEKVENAIKQYIQSLGIGEDFILSECIAKLMELYCIKDVEIREPKENTQIPIDTIAKVGNITLDYIQGD